MDSAAIEIYNDDELFIPKDWIGRHKKFNTEKLPTHVTNAHISTLKIPENFVHCHLPAQNISVIQFLAYKLPRVSSEIISSKVSTWFSNNQPTTDYNVLISRPVPSAEFIKRLDEASGQAWLDGATSVVDQRFNDGMDHLPFWVISYWKEVVRCEEIGVLWKGGMSWLDREERKSKETNLIEDTRALFRSITWAGKLSYCRKNTSTLHLAQMLGTRWLSDEHINMMVEELKDELEHNPKLKGSKVQIADLAFTREIAAVHEKLAYPDNKKRRTVLGRYQSQVEDGSLKRLYFPLHVNNNHWVAGVIDFKRRTFSFGDSLHRIGKGPGAPAKFIVLLQTWLKHDFGKRFKAQGNMLTHAIQDDTYSCAIITTNTIAHAVFNRPLWCPAHAMAERLSWFIRLSSLEKSCTTESTIASAEDQLKTDLDQDRINEPTRRIGLSIMDLLNPTSIPLSQDLQSHNYDSDTSSSESDRNGVEDDNASSMISGRMDTNSMFTDPGSSCVSDTTDPTGKASLPASWEVSSQFSKHPRSESSESNSGSSYKSDGPPLKKYIKTGEGSSKSAAASRALRQKLTGGTFKPDKAKYQSWKQKILKTDPDVEFDPHDCTRAHHSSCEKFIKVKEPYDFVHWKDHLEKCNIKRAGKTKKKAPTLFQMGWGRKKTPEIDDNNNEKELEPQIEVPCPGITQSDNPKVKQYLKRTGTLGEGGRALPVIAKKYFGKLFSKLKLTKNKQKVIDIQMHEWKWRNDHANLRVYSTSCQGMVADRSEVRHVASMTHEYFPRLLLVL